MVLIKHQEGMVIFCVPTVITYYILYQTKTKQFIYCKQKKTFFVFGLPLRVFFRSFRSSTAKGTEVNQLSIGILRPVLAIDFIMRLTTLAPTKEKIFIPYLLQICWLCIDGIYIFPGSPLTFRQLYNILPVYKIVGNDLQIHRKPF